MTYVRAPALRTMREAGPLSRRLNRIAVVLLAWSLGLGLLLRPATYRGEPQIRVCGPHIAPRSPIRITTSPCAGCPNGW